MSPDDFLREFEHLAETEGGMSKLREAVLQLAVLGRLEEQRGGESADPLIAECKPTQLRLEQQGTFKPVARVAAPTPESMSLAVPKSWVWESLGNLFRFIDYRGKTPKKLNSGIRLVTAKNVRMGSVDLHPEEFISPADYEMWMTRGLPTDGDLLFTTEAPLGKVALFEFGDEKVALAQRIITLHPYCSADRRFLLYMLMSPWFQRCLAEKATGMTATGIKAAKLKLLALPLPPLPEQKRIVDKVDQLMALCDDLEAKQKQKRAKAVSFNQAALSAVVHATDKSKLRSSWSRVQDHFEVLYELPENVKELRQTILQLAVMGKLVKQEEGDEPASELLREVAVARELAIQTGEHKLAKSVDPVPSDLTTPHGWAWRRLADLLVFGPRNGFSPKGVEYETHVKVLTLSATTRGVFQADAFKYADIEVEAESHLWLSAGDLLLQRANSLEYVGVAAIFTGADRTFIYPDLMMKLRPAAPLDVHFLHLCLNSVQSKAYFRNNASGTSGSMPKINQGVVNNLLVPIPPLAEQRRIVDAVEGLMSLCAELEAKLAQHRDQGQGLMRAIVESLVA